MKPGEAEPMRLICPNCQQSVTVPEAEAGKTVTCIHCAHSFPAPQLYAPPPLELPPPPPPQPAAQPLPPALPMAPAASKTEVTPETRQVPRVEPAAAPLPAQPEGYARMRSIALSRHVCEWLVPVCLTLIFVLSFFKWVGLYPAGYAAYTQNAWQALFGTMSVDPVAEKYLAVEKDLDERLRASWWMLPYLILLVLAFTLTWGERIAKVVGFKLPGLLERMMKIRPALLAACAGLTLIFILVQTIAGFSLERAVISRDEANFKEEREKARTPEEMQKVEMEAARVKGGYHLRTTTWLTLTILLHFIALAAIVGETLLIQRGSKPPPRLAVMW